MESLRLTHCCKSWMGLDFSPPLEPEGWYWEGHFPGIHIWALPPSVARQALSELAKFRFKRPYGVTHLFICPQFLWQEEWRRRFEKEMDFWFILNPGLA